MKLFKLFTLMAAGTMITACNNEIENLSRNADNRVMSLQTAGKAYTRFNDVTNTWENTDKIGVYMYGAGAGSTDILNGAENVLFTTQGGESPVNFTSETGIQIAGENAKFTAYYPQNGDITGGIYKGEFYQFNLSSCIRQQNSLTAQFVSFSLSNLANIFYPPQFLQ